MRVPQSCVSLLLAILTGGAAAVAAERECWTLRHHCGGHDTAKYQFGLSARAQVEESNAGKVEVNRVEMRLRMECLAEYRGVADDGHQSVIGRILSGTMRGAGREVEESRDIGETVFQYLLTPRAEMKRQRLTSGDPPAIFFSGVTLVFGPDDAFLADGVGVLPDGPVAIGDTWDGMASKPGPADGEPTAVAYTSTLLGVDEFQGRSCLKIRTVSTAELTDSAAMPGTRLTAHMAGTLASEHIWRFDPESGLIVSDEGSIDILVCERATGREGEARSMDTTAVINTRSVLTEYNGRKIGGQSESLSQNSSGRTGGTAPLC